ncbi:hypothetical protein QFC21_004774 [Naganishia friedmannii]|uniref:Uncharacterized protein n=1 Tax=Naganishia friedmannii TaxID=89922 RepID=A0ACC2VGJ7_9TREE|nr:hypothetical protein QFC21_004774 [Naganishia friedmannii]
MLYLSTTLIAAVALYGMVKAIPAPSESSDAGPSATSSIMPTPSSRTPFRMDEGFGIKPEDGRVLWNVGGPKPDDMAGATDRTAHSWTEFAAVTGAIMQQDSRWLPSVVFGAPSDFWSESPWVPSNKVARARTNQGNAAIAVPLNLFPASDRPLMIPVYIGKDEIVDTSPLWFQVLSRAFDHDKVIVRLREDPRFNPDNAMGHADMRILSAKDDYRKTAAIFEMLTGYKTQATGQLSTAELLKDDLDTSSTGGGLGNGTDGNPTVIYDTSDRLRPIIRNPVATEGAKLYRLLDNRESVANRNGTGLYDSFWDPDELFNGMRWMVRLGPDQHSLDLQQALENLKPLRNSFDFYYEDGRSYESYHLEPTRRP